MLLSLLVRKEVLEEREGEQSRLGSVRLVRVRLVELGRSFVRVSLLLSWVPLGIRWIEGLVELS